MRHQPKEIIIKRLILAITTLVFISSNAQNTTEEFSLTGITNGIENGTLLYLSNVSENKIMDFAKVENNSFSFNTKLSKSPLNAVLHTKDHSQYRFLWLENNKMKFDAKETDLAHATVTGSETETLKQAFRKEIEGLPLNERRQKEMEFVKKNPNSIDSASTLYVYSATWGKEKTKELFDLFSLENKNSEYGKSISKYLEINKNPSVGDKFIDFQMEDTSGKLKKLSDFKGKIVLLEFWASWCGPCKIVSPVIDQLSSELAGKAVFGKINVDDNPSVSNAFGIQSIPTIIIFKNAQAIDRVVGAMTKSQLISKIFPHIEKPANNSFNN